MCDNEVMEDIGLQSVLEASIAVGFDAWCTCRYEVEDVVREAVGDRTSSNSVLASSIMVEWCGRGSEQRVTPSRPGQYVPTKMLKCEAIEWYCPLTWVRKMRLFMASVNGGAWLRVDVIRVRPARKYGWLGSVEHGDELLEESPEEFIPIRQHRAIGKGIEGRSNVGVGCQEKIFEDQEERIPHLLPP